ncbi:MAG: BON domain-containing protein [Gemmatimonadales bacterium]
MANTYGDWARHPTGADSGARAQEGYSYPGEQTWGESQRAKEQEQTTGRLPGTDPQSAGASDDARIREVIRRRLAERPDLDASDIEVQVEGGEVTLAGTVAERDARWLAEDLLEAIPGVSLVHNHLRLSDR